MVDVIGVVNQVFFLVMLVLTFAVLAFGMGALSVMLFRFLKYRVKVVILEKVGEAWFCRTDMGQEYRSKGGKSELVLLKSKIRIARPDDAHFLASGFKKWLFLQRKSGELLPATITENSPANIGFSYSDLPRAIAWREQSRAKHLEDYKKQLTTFERFAPYILPLAMIVIMFVLFFVLIHQMQGGVTVRAVLDTSQLVT